LFRKERKQRRMLLLLDANRSVGSVTQEEESKQTVDEARFRYSILRIQLIL